MNSNYSKFIKSIHLLGDLLFINIAFLAAYHLKFNHLKIINDDKYFTLLLIFNLTWIFATYILRTYDIYRVTKYEKIISNLIQLFFIHTLLIAAFWVLRKAYYFSREHLMWTYIFLYSLITIWRLGLVYQLKKYRKKGFNFRNVIIAGYGDLSLELSELFNKNKELGYKLLGFFDDKNTEIDGYLGKIQEIKKYTRINNVDEIYCSIADLTTIQLRKLTEFADNNLIRIKMIPDVRAFVNRQLKIDFYEHLPILVFRNIPLDDAINRLIKRTFDIIFSSFVILFILSWLYPILAILVKLSSPGPILFKQTRSGINNKNFSCWKFRSMTVNKNADKLQASKNDTRITKIGAFMRKTSLDELPQFFNVLTGQMSVVGPRPHMVKHTEEYSQKIDKYMFRHFVKPGITGLAQVKGFRGETKDPKMMEYRIRMDMLYVESWSFLLDIRIIAQTIINIFKKEEYAY